jgi:hypothetical protein
MILNAWHHALSFGFEGWAQGNPNHRVAQKMLAICAFQNWNFRA